MADVHTLPGATPPPAPAPLSGLVSRYEQAYRVSDEDAPPALAFNPAATLLSLGCAALGRAESLHNSLEAWNCTDSTSATPADVAGTMMPVIDELVIILDRLVQRLDPRQSGLPGIGGCSSAAGGTTT